MSSSETGDRPETNAERVRAFHRAVHAHVPDHPTVPDPEILRLRKALISEEFSEVTAALDALEAGDTAPSDALVALAGELADLLYVVYGGFSDCGVDADAVFAEVHRANLTKAQGPKRADGKALKPPGWRPPNVRDAVYGP